MPTEPKNAELLKQLKDIALHLKNLDQRDHNRTVWNWVKTSIGFVMFVTALFGSWYFIDNLSEIMKRMVQESARQSQEIMKSGSENFLQQIQNIFGTSSSAASSPRTRTRSKLKK